MASIEIVLPDEILKRIEAAFGCHGPTKGTIPDGDTTREVEGPAYTLADAIKEIMRDRVAAFESQAMLTEKHAAVLGEKW